MTRERTCAIRSSSRVGWMAEVRLKETEKRLQLLQECVPISTPDQTPGPSLATVGKRQQREQVAALEETAEAARKADRERKKRSRTDESSKIR